MANGFETNLTKLSVEQKGASTWGQIKLIRLTICKRTLKTPPEHQFSMGNVCAHCGKEIPPYDDVTKKGGLTLSGFANIYHYHKECAEKVTPP